MVAKFDIWEDYARAAFPAFSFCRHFACCFRGTPPAAIKAMPPIGDRDNMKLLIIKRTVYTKRNVPPELANKKSWRNRKAHHHTKD
jgi:hypothetical protein